ncbi:MAG: PP2C family protein-serine/threonine phosphatase [Gammaproteobacteria bacterium]
MKFESAQISLLGNRSENQDRVAVFAEDDCLLLTVVDGMGGHSQGARAAEVTLEVLEESFANIARPVFDPQGFLTLTLAHAHERVVELGDGVVLEEKPRATCAVCLVQDGGAYWAHIGDSRIYQLRDKRISTRTRDHSHVELLLRQGVIGENDVAKHPMRNFVECCLGGDAALPHMSITNKRQLLAGDVLLACTDGLWSGVSDAEIGESAGDTEVAAEDFLRDLAEAAVENNSPQSDNTSAAALRWQDK